MISGGQTYGENENLTLTEADLSTNGGPRPYAGGNKLRAYCPVHGGDHQRSLEVDLETGRFFCHNCECWGYLDWAREEFARERGLDREAGRGRQGVSPGRSRRVVRPAPPPPPVEPVRDDLAALSEKFREALPGSLGEKYLEYRGVSLDVAREYGLGYAAPGQWPHRGRDWRWGRIVAAHTRPDGTLVSLYGRAVGRDEKVPKQMRHDHLPGAKGYWNAAALREGSGPLYICEGVMDALALIASGCERTVAIYAARDWRWHWFPEDVHRLVLAFDADETGVEAREKLAAEARLRGREVAYLDRESYGGHGDPAEAFAAGVLNVGEWPEASEADQRLLEEPPEPEPWDPVWSASIFPETLREVSRLVGGAGLAGEVDTSAADAAIDEMQDAYEREDTEALRAAAERAREEARRAVADVEGTGGEG